jgi:hypothetical protein
MSAIVFQKVLYLCYRYFTPPGALGRGGKVFQHKLIYSGVVRCETDLLTGAQNDIDHNHKVKFSL